MNFYIVFTLLRRHPLYKLKPDLFRQLALESRCEGGLSWPDFELRLKEFLPELWLYLEQNRSEYKSRLELLQQREKKAYRFIAFAEPLYPQEFYQMPDPPLCLAFFGEPTWICGRNFSVVGSRDPREESLLWMEKEFTPFVEKQGLNVISGGARGIDQKGHSIALRRKRPTTVILPSGLGELYPANLQSWIKPVLDAGGCFLSEYDFAQRMQKFLFHHRNRLIAALGKVVLIVEARQRSGTLITAQQAVQAGRPVLVVPGHPHDNHFAGSLELLTEGATLVRDAQDLDIFFQSEISSLAGGPVAVVDSLPIHH